MNSDNMKEVYFDQYCETCEHKDLEEWDHPCCVCLNEAARPDSHKPVHWTKGRDRYGTDT